VPFGLLAALTGCLVAPGVRGGHAQSGDGPGVLRAPGLGILCVIADQNQLVHATGPDALLLVARIVRATRTPSTGPSRRFRPRHHDVPQQAAPRVTPGGRSLFVLASTPRRSNRFRRGFLPSSTRLRSGGAALQPEKYEADDRNQDIAVKNDAGIARR